MTVSFTVPVYQRKLGSTIELITLGLGPSTQRRTAQGIPKAEEGLRDDLRKAVVTLAAGQSIDLAAGAR